MLTLDREIPYYTHKVLNITQTVEYGQRSAFPLFVDSSRLHLFPELLALFKYISCAPIKKAVACIINDFVSFI